MSAIRKLAQEAADNWLTRDQVQSLINLPDLETLKGFRDRAILAVMIGAGLRRSEVAALDFAHIQQRE
jgi:site-specific recombinase XerD